ncbi:hypothetical protein AMECASPLE_030923 [Ameca splendens]|uniref:Uncharacterized protein n=1 Tax=Ameca splendens TaxID=208324 RepID=A0ABV0XVD9_9TELE
MFHNWKRLKAQKNKTEELWCNKLSLSVVCEGLALSLGDYMNEQPTCSLISIANFVSSLSDSIRTNGCCCHVNLVALRQSVFTDWKKISKMCSAVSKLALQNLLNDD